MARSPLIGTLASSGAVMLLSMVTSILLARKLGPEGRGLLLSLTFLPGLFIAFCELSLNEATAFQLSREVANRDHEMVASFESAGLLTQLFAAVAAVAAVVVLLPVLLPKPQHSHLRLDLAYAVPFALLTPIDLHFKAVLQGRNAFLGLNLLRLMQPGGYAVALVALAVMGRVAVPAVLFSIVAALVVSLVVGVACVRPRWRAPAAIAVKRTVQVGARYHASNVLLFIGTELDKMIGLFVLSQAQLGFYAVGVSLSLLGSGIVVQSVGLLIVRDMAGVATQGRARVFGRYVQGSTLLLILINGGAAVSTAIWLPLVYGTQFAPAESMMSIMMLVGAMRGVRSVADRALRASGHVAWGMAAELVGIATLPLLAIWAARRAGLEGFALALLFSQGLALSAILLGACARLQMRVSALNPFQRSVFEDLADVALRQLALLRGGAR